MIGQTISHYRIIEKLGVAGWVWSIRPRTRVSTGLWPLSSCRKILPRNRQALERFRREAKAASALNHPNICTIYYIGEETARRSSPWSIWTARR